MTGNFEPSPVVASQRLKDAMARWNDNIGGVDDDLDALTAAFARLSGRPGLTREHPFEPAIPAIWNCPPVATGTPNAANEFRGCQVFVPHHVRVDRARVRCSSASAAVFAVGVYLADGSERVTGSGPVAVPPSEANVAAELQEAVLEPGFYFVGVACSLSSVSWHTGRHAILGGGQQAGVDPSALPASLSLSGPAGTSAPCVGLYHS